ncbi:phosphoribosylaminoimidazolesuccinocarboxamide synthase [Thermodesulfovibrionales bacterium]|nr:phosphoribosylaminoimidazolesuccinocarboxamide synthase [Thermodesulfovibrionales bacterium]
MLSMYPLEMGKSLTDIKLLKSGKVRDVYELSDNHLLIVTTDRVSAFDVVLPNEIPDKGRLLTEISIYWFNQMKDIIKNHVVATDARYYPEILDKYKDILAGRSMIVKRADPLPVECIVRGYLSGSGWKEYKEKGTVCGIGLPERLVESSRLNEAVFTPSTKAKEGHDINITLSEMKEIVGDELAERLKEISLRIYKRAREMAEKKGMIIADTKMEFGIYEGRLILIDELLTPDSSRFWSMKDYQPASRQDSFDKQIVRDYLLTLDWNKRYPAPLLPDEIVQKTEARYREIVKILTK